MKPIILIFAILLSKVVSSFAQYPQYFTYDTDNGLPSNEVYSIVQDANGIIWIGCDAGLFKFDGIRYTAYKCKTQQSKSIAGLTIASSGKIYCYNFQSQIFCLDDDSLLELKHSLPNAIINSLVSDVNGNIYVTHAGGISSYNETNSQWKDYFDYSPIKTINNSQLAGKSIKGNLKKEIYFAYSKGIATIENNKVTIKYNTPIFNNASAAIFEIEYYNQALWVFSKEHGIIYTFNNTSYKQIQHTKLNEVLSNRKITNVKALSDSCLWISTYKGIVRFDARKNTVDLFYPETSFSDVLLDRENNYWFSTLQAGILCVPNMTFSVWNNFENNRFVKITADSTNIYFASVNGIIGKLNGTTNELKTFYTGNDADVQSFDYDFKDNTLYFNINSRLHTLNNNNLGTKNTHIYATKSFQKINNTEFALSSQGVFINNKKVNNEWATMLKYDEHSLSVWVATNNGLQKYKQQNNEWQIHQTYLPKTQILSIDFNEKSKTIFALTFDGRIYTISETQPIQLLTQLPGSIQANKFILHRDKLYVASSNGIWIYDVTTKKWDNINTLSGLVSEDIQDLTFLNNTLWIVTSKGLQKIPLNGLNIFKPLAKIYFKDKFRSAGFQIKYNESLVLNPEASIYSANGRFQFAYRVNKMDWVKLPASIEQIKIQNLPTGAITVELKVIDHLGRDSENSIVLKGYVSPPYWKSWWFITCLFIAGIIITIAISKVIIRNIRRKEISKTQLINSQLKAIRAQMNPHFMYNTLNSIQDLILQNDIKNTNYYLSKFSQLMRQILHFSEEDNVLLSEEVEMLSNYLELEKLRFGNDFIFAIDIESHIDVNRTYIPSLIVQPYIENAVKHGLLHKSGTKHLTIAFTQSANQLKIVIEDNGVGRKRSEEIKKRNTILHKSFAENAVQKRIALLNNANATKIEIITTDIHPEEINTGTRVSILLPMNSNQPFVND